MLKLLGLLSLLVYARAARPCGCDKPCPVTSAAYRCTGQGLVTVPRLRKDAVVGLLQNNNISKVGVGSFRGNSALRILDLTDNDLGGISDSAFVTLRMLQKLKAGHNNLRAITSRTFLGLTNLLELVLTANQLVTVDGNAFKGMRKLTKLLLNDNRLSRLIPNTFGETSALATLDLGGNAIGAMPSGLIGNLVHLRSLGTMGNRLSCTATATATTATATAVATTPFVCTTCIDSLVLRHSAGLDCCVLDGQSCGGGGGGGFALPLRGIEHAEALVDLSIDGPKDMPAPEPDLEVPGADQPIDLTASDGGAAEPDHGEQRRNGGGGGVDAADPYAAVDHAKADPYAADFVAEAEVPLGNPVDAHDQHRRAAGHGNNADNEAEAAAGGPEADGEEPAHFRNEASEEESANAEKRGKKHAQPHPLAADGHHDDRAPGPDGRTAETAAETAGGSEASPDSPPGGDSPDGPAVAKKATKVKASAVHKPGSTGGTAETAGGSVVSPGRSQEQSPGTPETAGHGNSAKEKGGDDHALDHLGFRKSHSDSAHGSPLGKTASETVTNWHGDTPEHEESEEEKEMMKENIIDPNGPAGLGPGWNPKNEHHGAMNGQGGKTMGAMNMGGMAKAYAHDGGDPNIEMEEEETYEQEEEEEEEGNSAESAESAESAASADHSSDRDKKVSSSKIDDEADQAHFVNFSTFAAMIVLFVLILVGVVRHKKEKADDDGYRGLPSHRGSNSSKKGFRNNRGSSGPQPSSKQLRRMFNMNRRVGRQHQL